MNLILFISALIQSLLSSKLDQLGRPLLLQLEHLLTSTQFIASNSLSIFYSTALQLAADPNQLAFDLN
ncbi:hypothetical protein F511_02018 [Dorcoceras hygrometricum]|uniref:Uncharacterized protein n=1 Tax=Dorcoceras hygrometricum TaxID=472368 RepID=A0A2Z7AA63_9LAMI|nr:hypothetical protein F511_02018 [Dorcoceras hygrometricum]